MDGQRYDSKEGIGTTTRKREVELRRERQPRVESGTETENNAWCNCREKHRTPIGI